MREVPRRMRWEGRRTTIRGAPWDSESYRVPTTPPPPTRNPTPVIRDGKVLLHRTGPRVRSSSATGGGEGRALTQKHKGKRKEQDQTHAPPLTRSLSQTGVTGKTSVHHNPTPGAQGRGDRHDRRRQHGRPSDRRYPVGT